MPYDEHLYAALRHYDAKRSRHDLFEASIVIAVGLVVAIGLVGALLAEANWDKFWEFMK
jgi:hypothetical protein